MVLILFFGLLVVTVGGQRRSSLTPGERRLRAQVAVHTSWQNTPDPSARTAPARAAFDQRFEDQVDPDRVLPEAERLRRAASAKKAFFSRLALKSAQARRRRADA
jgi:hypothetical protein